MNTEIEAIRRRRSLLENEIGLMLRNFQSEYDVLIRSVEFTHVEAQMVGQPERPRVVRSDTEREFVIGVAL